MATTVRDIDRNYNSIFCFLNRNNINQDEDIEIQFVVDTKSHKEILYVNDKEIIDELFVKYIYEKLDVPNSKLEPYKLKIWLNKKDVIRFALYGYNIIKSD